jgi:hypothetical protein
MPTILSRGCFLLVAALLLPAVPFANTAMGQDFVGVDRQVARTWAMHRIAVIQAAEGDVNGALNTIAQINDPEVVRNSGDVTVVCFCNGIPLYDHLPAPPEWKLFDQPDTVIFDGRRTADHVPAAAPQGLPRNYLAADPRHGAVVNFSDEYDSRGRRVTSRRYADGYTVIETPRTQSTSR